ncbi:hypothetical protein J8L85_09295 [Maribacter sp. MMG018]|uniref:helix-turn-helix transcriptional regulator n=1 Tax=Maribacter sp. MMG018 TaxID=2822688 RepID=UPI001B35998B|nr:hypothetical protein [Maribacter sp. MMG018]MBQ4914627.1 hypothetical protein [Maribacter sp. MMG018]
MNFSSCVAIFLFFINLSNAQTFTPTPETVDDQIEQSKQEFSKLNFYQSISYAKKAFDGAESISYSKGKTIASIYLAKALIEIGEYKKALSFISKAEREEFFSSYINMQVESYRLKGRLYGSLDMNLLAEKEFKKQLLHSKKIKNQNQRGMSRFWSYQNLVHIYDKTNNKDSLDKYLVLQENSVNRLNETANFYSISATYCQIARNLMKNSKFQEAKNYLDRSNDILHKYDSSYLFQHYDCYATYEKLTGNLKEAERYYDLALQNALELKDLDAIVGQYKNMSDFFINDMKDVKTGKKYLLLYHKYNDSLKTINSNIQDDVYNEILKEKYEVSRQVGGRYEYVVLGVLVIGLVPIGFIYYRKIKYKRKIKVLETKIDGHDKTEQSKIEGQRHKELMAAANANSPDFLLLFKELYPEVVVEIKKRNKNVLNSDIVFLGMAHLNFSTKDLAKILNVTVRAIQVRKNRLRKKYNIPSEIDFNLWYGVTTKKEID